MSPQHPLSSIFEVPAGSLSFSHRVSPEQESIHVLIDDLLLIFEFLQESSGTLQIHRTKDKTSNPGPVIHVLDVPTKSKLRVACPKDSSQLTTRLRSTNNMILILSFDWSTPEASHLQNRSKGGI